MKEKIFLAAKKLFAKKGFLETTIRDIAKEAKVSRGLIHWYYKSKDELIKEVALTSFPHHQIEKVIEKTYPNVRSFFETLCKEYISFYSDALNRKIFLNVLSLKERFTDIEKVHQILTETVMEEGAKKLASLGCKISYNKAEIVFRTLYSSLFFYIQNEEHIKIKITDFFETLIDILLKGISCE